MLIFASHHSCSELPRPKSKFSKYKVCFGPVVSKDCWFLSRQMEACLFGGWLTIASMFEHTCTVTTSFTPVISLQELELMSGTWCWRWSREKPLTLSIHTMDNSLGPIIGKPHRVANAPRQHIYHPSPCSRVKMNTRLYCPRACWPILESLVPKAPYSTPSSQPLPAVDPIIKMSRPLEAHSFVS